MKDFIQKIKEIMLSKDDTRRKAAVICAIVAVVAAIVAVCVTVSYVIDIKKSEEKMEDLRPVMETIPASLADTGTAGEKTTEAAEEPVELIPNPYADTFAQNEDMAAWLVVDGTPIDYPVMQTMDDENYYLNRDFYKNDDKSGCLILDTDSDLYGENATTNLIIHGHNMKAGTMFGTLDEYQSEDYYKEHKTIELYTKEDKRSYEVIAVFRSQVFYSTDQVFKYYNFFSADTQEEFDDFYNNIKKMSLYDTGVTAELGDNFITLSTCAYHVEDGRFVVVGKEVDISEHYE
jgi:sortase B